MRQVNKIATPQKDIYNRSIADFLVQFVKT